MQDLPAAEIKIDRSFISGLTSTHRNPLIVRSTIELAHALEMKVTAEGVDGPMAAALLTVMGCDMLQGYHIHAPLRMLELAAFMRQTGGVLPIGAGLNRRTAIGLKSGGPAAPLLDPSTTPTAGSRGAG